MLAPIILFVYNRPWHTRQTVEALQKSELSKESDLFIYSDAAKKPVVENAVREVRDYIKTIQGFKKVTIIEREKNWGLANSIIDGVTHACSRFGRVIVLEDDLLVSRHFLRYMNQSLDRYADDEEVMQISGHMFPVSISDPNDAVFLGFTSSWGWATWQRVWQYFDAEAKGYEALRHNRTMRRSFDLDGSYPYFDMLEHQLAGRIDSWAIRWWLTVFQRNGLVLYPKNTLVENIGFDGSGTHCNSNGSIAKVHFSNEKNTMTFPTVELNLEVKSLVYCYLKKTSYPSLLHRVLKRLLIFANNFTSRLG